jgi:diguanylate cyclase (GGDEF)-like protein/PAS domain S-box-containing protein
MGSEVTSQFAGDLGDVAAALADPVLLINRLGDLRWGNAAAEQLFGVSLADGVGRNMLEFLHPDDVEIALVAVEAMDHKEIGTLLEVRIRGVDGWRVIEVRGASFGDDILLSVRDIADRRRWEVASDEAAAFRALMQNGASITMVLERGGEIRSSSSVVTRLLRHDQEQLEGQPLACIVEELDRGSLAIALDAVRAPGTRPVTVDLRLLHHDNHLVPFALTFTNLLDDPSLGAIVVTGHDISDRMVVEEQLRDSNSLLATTLESTAEGILVVDLSGEVTSFNRRFAEMWMIADDVRAAGRDGQVFASVLDQLVDPDAFLANVQRLNAASDTPSHDIVQFKDGRVYESRSRPRRLADECVGRVWSFQDITEHELLKHQLAHQALHDSLTDLANMTLFRDRIAHSLTRLHRSEGRVAVLFVDLDDFKHVNDTFGHWAGDAVLVQVSQRITNQLRVADTAARLGGDEFAVLVDDLTDGAPVDEIARRIIDALQQPITVGTRQLALTASIGIAYGDETADTDELLRHADIAMYAAKAQGKNCARTFTPEMHSTWLDRFEPRFA